MVEAGVAVPQALESGDLIDVEEAAGSSEDVLNADLIAITADDDDDDIVIADDLAEDAIDDLEHTTVGVPPIHNKS